MRWKSLFSRRKISGHNWQCSFHPQGGTELIALKAATDKRVWFTGMVLVFHFSGISRKGPVTSAHTRHYWNICADRFSEAQGCLFCSKLPTLLEKVESPVLGRLHHGVTSFRKYMRVSDKLHERILLLGGDFHRKVGKAPIMVLGGPGDPIS